MIKNKILLSVCLSAGLMLLGGCEAETDSFTPSSPSSSTSEYKLCYDQNGSSLSTVCRIASSLCSSDGKSVFDTYSSSSDCSSAQSAVRSYFTSNGSLPTASSVSSGSSSSSGSSDGSSSSPNTSSLNINCAGTNIVVQTISACASAARTLYSGICSNSSSNSSACNNYFNCLTTNSGDPTTAASVAAAVRSTCGSL